MLATDQAAVDHRLNHETASNLLAMLRSDVRNPIATVSVETALLIDSLPNGETKTQIARLSVATQILMQLVTLSAHTPDVPRPAQSQTERQGILPSGHRADSKLELLKHYQSTQQL